MNASQKKYIAEALGTFVLALGVALSVADAGPLATPIVAALSLGVMVYVIGGISGCHINPAVTAGLWSRGVIGTNDAVSYIVAQLIGGFVASCIVAYSFGGVEILGMGQDGFAIFGAEAAGAFLLVLGITAVVDGRVSQGASGLTIGSSLLIGILTAAHWSAGVVNPAVAVGLGSISVSYILGPIIGGVAAASLSKLWIGKKK